MNINLILEIITSTEPNLKPPDNKTIYFLYMSKKIQDSKKTWSI